MKRTLYGIGCAALLALGAASCGGSGGGSNPGSTGSGAVNGTLGGSTMNVHDAVLLNGQVTMTNEPGLCADAMSCKAYKEQQFLLISVLQNNGTVTSPGTFPVSQFRCSNGATVDYYKTDSRCQFNGADIRATSGTVTITNVATGANGTVLSGTFDVILATNEEITGSFTAPYCGADPTACVGADGGVIQSCM